MIVLYIKNCMIMVIKMRNSFKYYTSSGTSSFEIIVKSLNLNENDEVIVPVTLCQSIIDVIIKNKLKPVFVDVDDNFLIDKKLLKNKISKFTKIIVFVEQYGGIINDYENYYNKSGERITKVLDSCQNIVIFNKSNFDFIFYSFGKHKPIDLGKYSMILSKRKLNISFKLKYKYIHKIHLQMFTYMFKYIKKICIRKLIEKRIKIPGYVVNNKNVSYHRIIYVMNISRKEFNSLENKLYDYMSKEKLDIVQTTLETVPFEKLKVKNEFKNFEKLRYRSLYFRSDNSIKNYLKIIKYLNSLYILNNK